MAQTFFIDSDEEIISVIGYLRKSPEAENYFVFPKRSLVLQSAVNLRLFQREAEKQGKRIIIISQDENGRQLAERVGIPTKEYAAEMNTLRPETAGPMNSGKSPNQLPPTNGSNQFGTPQKDERLPAMPSLNHLGSDTFVPTFASGNPVNSASLPQPALKKTAVPENNEHRLRIRDASPQYQTSLNSVRSDVRPPVAPPQRMAPPRQTERIENHPSIQPEVSMTYRQPNSFPNAIRNEDVDLSGRNQRLERFFQRESAGEVSSPKEAQAATQSYPDFSAIQPSVLPPIKKSPAKSSSWKAFLISLMGIAVVSGVGAAVYFFLPKASVLITPHEITHEVEARFEGRTIVPIGSQDDNLVPVRKVEKNYESTVSIESSGKASSGNQKARGTLVISNEYSSDTQPLIATTRFETGEGKIFRLAESVTVPGMTIIDGKRQPGIVEAVVIADAPGDAYNIAPTDFTITGFKGGPKYEKIRARSSKSFSGGGGSEESISSITKEDIDSGIQKLKEQSKKDFLSAVEQELLPDERLLVDSSEVTDTERGELPLAGSLGERFDIRGSFSGRAFVVSEKVLKEKLAGRNLPERKGVSFRVTDATISYQGVLPRYDENEVTFDVRATLMLSSVIETEKLRAELLGSDEDGIKSILEKHAEIKKIEVNFSPEFLFHNIPRNEKRVSVQVLSEQ